MDKITKNFSREEFDCKDGTPVPEKYRGNLERLCRNLQVLRDDIGEPIHITSGYRTPRYNKKVGGKPASKHLKAGAGDFTTKNRTPKQLYKRIEELIKEGRMEQGGLHAYPGFVHYDPRGVRARW
jgi:uncharacterized protein YcbK (DUF882 family)